MSAITAREPKPRAHRMISFVSWACLASALAALATPGCGDPKPVVIARFPADASAAGGSAEGGAAESGAAGVAHTLPSIATPRGRVRVVDGRLETDIGTPLRGALLPVDTGWMLTNFDMITNIAETTGLNTLHVYLEDAGQVTGSMASQADALVSLSAQAGLYLILGVGTGTAIGMPSAKKVSDFWTYYGVRYANSSHVLYEIQNNPEYTCGSPITAATLTLESDTYALIRSVAPETHVLMFSTTSIVKPTVFTDAVQRLGSTVDWSNASFDMDVTDDCLALTDFGQLVAAAKAVNVPLMIGQLPKDGWGPYITTFEQSQVSWSHFRWFANNLDIASFQKATVSAAVSWCPERGTFPEDASACH